MRCDYLDLEGKCKGPYRGFGCIKDRCRAEKQAGCEYNEQGFYCRKYRKFECIGIANCATIDDYMSFVAARKKKAHSSK